MNARSYVLGSLLLVAACGDNGNSTKCGANTTLTNGECVADGGPTCGANTTLMGGMCVATTGPTCGLGTVLSGGHCVADTSAPGPVTGLTATVNGASIDLAWTAGSSSTATLVARLVAGADDQPAANTAYAVGDTLPGGAKVIAVGAPTTFADAFTTPGRYSYRAWSINASGNYGLGREVAALAALPSQSGAVSLDLTAATATVTTQPANVAIALANLTFTTDHATVDVTLTNNTAGPLYSPRIIFSGLSVGTLNNPADVTLAGDGFVIPTYGGLLPGAPVTTTIRIDGLLVTDTVTANLAVEESGLAIVGGNAVATKGGGAATLQIPNLRGNQNSDVYFYTGAFAPSGRYFYGTSRWTTGLSRVDTATGAATTIAAFSTLAGTGTCMMVTEGTAYVGYLMGRHRRNGGNQLGVAQIDLGSMTVLKATTLDLGGNFQSNACTFHGTKMALGAGPTVYLFDTTTMAFVDTVPGTAGVIDGVATGLGNVRSIAFDVAGTSLYATDKSVTIVKIDPAFAVTTYVTSTSARPMHALTVDPAGTLWWVADNGLWSFDGTTQATVPNFGTQINGIVALSTTSATVFNFNRMFDLDLTTGAVTGVSAFDNSSRVGHSLQLFQ